MGTATNHSPHLARWLIHRLPDIHEGTAPKNRGKAPYQVDLSIGQFTNREADRSEDRSPLTAFALPRFSFSSHSGKGEIRCRLTQFTLTTFSLSTHLSGRDSTRTSMPLLEPTGWAKRICSAR